MRGSLYNAGKRDANEGEILALLKARNVGYVQLRPGQGADLIVEIQPMEYWEIKDPAQRWTLTEEEKEKQIYCNSIGIPYIIVLYVDQANARLNLYFTGQR